MPISAPISRDSGAQHCLRQTLDALRADLAISKAGGATRTGRVTMYLLTRRPATQNVLLLSHNNQFVYTTRTIPLTCIKQYNNGCHQTSEASCRLRPIEHDQPSRGKRTIATPPKCHGTSMQQHKKRARIRQRSSRIQQITSPIPPISSRSQRPNLSLCITSLCQRANRTTINSLPKHRKSAVETTYSRALSHEQANPSRSKRNYVFLQYIPFLVARRVPAVRRTNRELESRSRSAD